MPAPLAHAIDVQARQRVAADQRGGRDEHEPGRLGDEQHPDDGHLAALDAGDEVGQRPMRGWHRGRERWRPWAGLFSPSLTARLSKAYGALSAPGMICGHERSRAAIRLPAHATQARAARLQPRDGRRLLQPRVRRHAHCSHCSPASAGASRSSRRSSPWSARSCSGEPSADVSARAGRRGGRPGAGRARGRRRLRPDRQRQPGRHQRAARRRRAASTPPATSAARSAWPTATRA